MLAQAIPYKRWTREDCVAMEQAGIIDSERYELVDGAVLQKMPKKYPRIRALVALLAWLRTAYGDMCIVPESPLDVAPNDNPTSEPEPDIVVLDLPIQQLGSRPAAAHALLVIEVSDSTLLFDLNIKAALYARAGIREYWVVDVNSQRLVVHRDPADGRYQAVATHTAEESVTPLSAPSSSLPVASLF